MARHRTASGASPLVWGLASIPRAGLLLDERLLEENGTVNASTSFRRVRQDHPRQKEDPSRHSSRPIRAPPRARAFGTLAGFARSIGETPCQTRAPRSTRGGSSTEASCSRRSNSGSGTRSSGSSPRRESCAWSGNPGVNPSARAAPATWSTTNRRMCAVGRQVFRRGVSPDASSAPRQACSSRSDNEDGGSGSVGADVKPGPAR